MCLKHSVNYYCKCNEQSVAQVDIGLAQAHPIVGKLEDSAPVYGLAPVCVVGWVGARTQEHVCMPIHISIFISNPPVLARPIPARSPSTPHDTAVSAHHPSCLQM